MGDITNKDTPLQVTVEDDQLVIRIGIDVVKYAAEEMEDNNRPTEDGHDFQREWIVTDALEFAKDVRLAMQDESEDGSTPLILFLDKMCLAAIESGSLATDDAPKHHCDRCDEED